MSDSDFSKLLDPFPVQGFRITDGSGVPDHTIPKLYAIIAYRAFLRNFGRMKTLEDISRIGGFEFNTFLDLLNGGNGNGDAYAANHLPRHSIKNKIPIVTMGTKEWDDEVRYLQDQQEMARRASGRVVVGYGTTGDRQK